MATQTNNSTDTDGVDFCGAIPNERIRDWISIGTYVVVVILVAEVCNKLRKI